MNAANESTISAETKTRALEVLRALPADWTLCTAWSESESFRWVAIELGLGTELVRCTVADAIALVEGL